MPTDKAKASGLLPVAPAKSHSMGNAMAGMLQPVGACFAVLQSEDGCFPTLLFTSACKPDFLDSRLGSVFVV